ncbi:MAG: ComEA family DNA-binding protein [Microgenomates group bacterium]|jgi:competence protein ComEA
MNSENNLEDLLSRYKILIIVGVVGTVLLVGGIISSGIIPKTFLKSSKQAYPSSNGEVNGIKKTIEVKVDVSGAIVSPGVYSLSLDSRVEDALKMAGGVTEEADPVYVSKTINLAQKVADGMKIYVPKVSENIGTDASSQGNSVSAIGLININEAALADLDKLPGVGAVTAQKIIDNRPYSGIEDLVTKKAVSRSVYEKIKAQISTW